LKKWVDNPTEGKKKYAEAAACLAIEASTTKTIEIRAAELAAEAAARSAGAIEDAELAAKAAELAAKARFLAQVNWAAYNSPDEKEEELKNHG